MIVIHNTELYNLEILVIYSLTLITWGGGGGGGEQIIF